MKKTISLIVAGLGIFILTSGAAWHLKAKGDLEKAENYAAQQRWDAAKEAYKRVLAKDDTHLRANLMIGRISYRQGAFYEAIKYLSKVPSDVCWATLTLGWCYDAIGDRGKAIEAYERTLQQNPQESVATAARLGLETPHSPTKKVKRDESMNDVEVPIMGWRAVADPNPEDASKAYDRDPKTRWASMVPQSPGMAYQIDLGSTRVVNRVVLNDDADGTTIYVSDYPRAYTVEVSPDGEQWKVVASEVGDLNSYAGAFFEPTEARYIKITQKGSTAPEWWSIYEVYVYSPAN